MIYVGIDPGLSGALAMIEKGVVRVFDTPVLVIKNGKKQRRVMDGLSVISILRRELSITDTGSCSVAVALEKVSAMPGQGVTSMFHFGEGYGMWQGILVALGLSYTLVHPTTWKKEIMRDMPKEKAAAIVRAKQLYPKAADQLTRKKDDGRADAILLAHYGRKNL